MEVLCRRPSVFAEGGVYPIHHLACCFLPLRMDSPLLRSTKRLVRHCRSRAYFQNGSWTENAEAATNFSTIEEVAQACVNHGLKDVELVLQFEHKVGELTFPIR